MEQDLRDAIDGGIASIKVNIDPAFDVRNPPLSQRDVYFLYPDEKIINILFFYFLKKVLQLLNFKSGGFFPSLPFSLKLKNYCFATSG